MEKILTIKNLLNLNSLKTKLRNFISSISKRYLCIEIGYNHILISEIYYSNDKINFNKIKKVDIPEEAFDKGIPNDIESMTTLIKEVIEEEKYRGFRTAIVISPEAVYTRLIDIPKSIKDKDVYKYLVNPESLVQIPISISKSDFQVQKTTFLQSKDTNREITNYFFTAIPKKSVDTLIKICESSKLELNYLETAFNAFSRLIDNEIFDKPNQICIVLELLTHCTNLTLVDQDGPIFNTRLTSIKDYHSEIGSMEKENKEEYLPISKLDLKALVKEIKNTINQFFNQNIQSYNFKIVLGGINSSHPNLAKTFGEYIKLPTYIISTINHNDIGKVKFSDKEYYESSLVRIFGLSLGLLKKNQDLVKKNLKSNYVDFYDPSKKNYLNNNSPSQNQSKLIKEKNFNIKISQGTPNKDQGEKNSLKIDSKSPYINNQKNKDNQDIKSSINEFNSKDSLGEIIPKNKIKLPENSKKGSGNDRNNEKKIKSSKNSQEKKVVDDKNNLPNKTKDKFKLDTDFLK